VELKSDRLQIELACFAFRDIENIIEDSKKAIYQRLHHVDRGLLFLCRYLCGVAMNSMAGQEPCSEQPLSKRGQATWGR